MSFGKDMSMALDRIDGKIRKSVSGAFHNLCTKIVDDTPVGDITRWTSLRPRSDIGTKEVVTWKPPKGYVPGTLVNSWHSGIGQEIPINLTVREPNTSGVTSLGQISEVADKAPGNIAWFANPAPYANRIEYAGHSTQAPAGMVRINVRIFKDLLRIAINGSS